VRATANPGSRSLRDDSQKGNVNCKGRSRFPEGMTERKAKATAKCRDLSTARFGRDDGLNGLEVVVGAEVADYLGGVAVLGIYG
jgi:hypothetical protein